ncbi:MAG: DUF1576 domain-containing protein [Ruminococcaceae bacterium]|nr:DUF1576 domain-containing protein [Oscillospiraceae bacterium]
MRQFFGGYMSNTDIPLQAKKHKSTFSERLIRAYPLFISLFFLIASPIAVLYTKEWDFFDNLWRILTSPSKLVTDYFALGGLGSTLFNAAVCGLFANLVIYVSRAKANATILAGYMLIVAHCFYGLNFINMWPSFLGVLLYCIVLKRPISENIHVAFFSTALAPFVSEVLFRYSIGKFDASVTQISAVGIILSIVCGLAIGFVVPALLPGTTAMHRGYNLYKAGLAIGILGIFIHAFMYQTLGVNEPADIIIDNPNYYSLPYAYRGFMNVFFVILFSITFLVGFILNKRSFKDYGKLLKCTGYGTDFTDKFGMPLCMINIAIYGFAILAYLNIIFILPEIFPQLPTGVGFTGATVGIVFAALTFAADGQHPRNVLPIALGYIALLAIVIVICLLSGFDIPWTLSTQAYINGLAFATGLCPIAGKYGFGYGVLAGLLSAMICAVTADMHGGFVLYNGGFNAGLTALVLIPILDFYKVKPKHDDDI